MRSASLYIFLFLTAMSLTAQGLSQEFVPGQLLMRHRADADPNEVQRALKSHGAAKHDEIPGVGVRIIRVPEPAIDRVRTALSRTGLFEFVEIDGLARGEAIPDDPYLASQWHMYTIDAPNAWLTSLGANAIPIAIVDSGIDAKHPDLAAKVLAGWNFVAASANTSDVLGHGTKVAGTAAAVTNNRVGVAGIAALNPVMPLVVLNSSNYASYSNIAKAIVYAADRGVRIINVSITGKTSSITLQNAVNYAWNKGALVIAAAGNSGTSAPGYPAACDKVVAVGATDASDRRASFSNYGSWIDLVAPGVGIYTTMRGGGYGAVSGTSFAAPLTAGVVALLLSVRPDLTPSSLSTLLIKGTADLGPAGFDNTFGHGRLNAYRTLISVPMGATQK